MSTPSLQQRVHNLLFEENYLPIVHSILEYFKTQNYTQDVKELTQNHFALKITEENFKIYLNY